MLNISNNEQIIPKLVMLLRNVEYYNSLINKVKKLLNLNSDIFSADFEEMLDHQIIRYSSHN